MIINSHAYLAKEIATLLKEKDLFLLNTSLFKWGSILPDIDLKRKANPHEIEYSLPFILEKTNQLLLLKAGEINMISKELGIITHFLADFFCLAHNDKKIKKNPWQHFNYELILHRKFPQFKLKDSPSEIITVSEIEDWLIYNHKKYLKQEPSFTTDISYIKETCMTISYVILDKLN